MTQRAGGAGRHRSPWGRSGRILPVRWGRLIAVGAAVVVAVGSLLLVRWATRGSGEPQAGRPGSVVAPLSATSSPVASGPATGPAAGASPSTAVSAAAGGGGPAAPVPASTEAAAGGRSGSSGDTPGTPGLRVTTGPEATPVGSKLGLSRSAVDLGAVATSDSFDVVSQGTLPVEFAVGPTPEWLDVSPDGARLGAGERASLKVSIDRSAAPVGPVQVDVRVSPVNGAGGGTVRVTATVSGPPQIVSVVAAPGVIHPSGCAPANGPTLSIVRVVAEDSTGIFGVDVVARLPDGRTTTTSLGLDTAAGTRSTWSGGVGPARSAGSVTLTVVATDLDGLRVEKRGSVTVSPCPS